MKTENNVTVKNSTLKNVTIQNGSATKNEKVYKVVTNREGEGRLVWYRAINQDYGLKFIDFYVKKNVTALENAYLEEDNEGELTDYMAEQILANAHNDEDKWYCVVDENKRPWYCSPRRDQCNEFIEVNAKKNTINLENVHIEEVDCSRELIKLRQLYHNTFRDGRGRIKL
jgi:hypothetical protein